ncbi:MAG: helix-turn-helix transcriptional regulator [Phycisphaeraceae bacterium]
MAKRYATLSQAVKDAIEQDPRSLREIARETGVSVSSISRWLQGSLILRVDRADKLAALYGMSVHVPKTPKPRKPRGGA